MWVRAEKSARAAALRTGISPLSYEFLAFFVLFFVSIIQNVSLAIGGLCSMMVFGILAADLLGVVHLLPKKSISLPWSCSYLASLFLVLISIPAANSTAFCYIESATAEFEVIDRDFAHDGNKHQV